MPPLSAVLITLNEECDLPVALRSLGGLADEIVVVDSGSSDRTCAIASQFGAKLVSRPFSTFAQQKNFAAAQAAHDWILSLDADEALSPALRAALAEWKSRTPDCAAYRISRRTAYLGKWIRYSGWYPDYHLRLYRRDLAEFRGSLHESLHARGRVGRLEGELLHCTARSLSEHYEKIERYTTLAAEDLFSRGRKLWRPGMYFAAPWTFLTRLVFQFGFLDGYHGLLIAWTSARYVWLKYRKLGRLLSGNKPHRSRSAQAGDG